MALLLVVFSGCVTPLERQAREIEARTFELSLQRQVQSHIYGMNCMALLPLAADYLWAQGYGDSRWIGDREGLISEWREEEGGGRSQYEIHSQELGREQCTIQALHRPEEGGVQRRDPRWELEFLETVSEEEAGMLRFRARQEADQAYRDVLENYQER